MSKRTSWRGVLTLLLVAGFAASAAAQSTLGRLSGTVLDASGGVLPGATITLTSEQTNQVQTSVSSETGAFVFPQVPVGTYKVEIGMQGFRSATFTKVSVAVGQEYALTARLQLGNVSENITVEGTDVEQWPVGQRVRVGGAQFEITMVCDPCHRMDELRDGLRAELQGKRGMLARVVESGEVAVGDDVTLV